MVREVRQRGRGGQIPFQLTCLTKDAFQFSAAALQQVRNYCLRPPVNLNSRSLLLNLPLFCSLIPRTQSDFPLLAACRTWPRQTWAQKRGHWLTCHLDSRRATETGSGQSDGFSPAGPSSALSSVRPVSRLVRLSLFLASASPWPFLRMRVTSSKTTSSTLPVCRPTLRTAPRPVRAPPA